MERLQTIVEALERGPYILILFAAVVRKLMGYDTTRMDTVKTVAASAFLVIFIAPGVAEWFELGPKAAASTGAVLALISKPLVDTAIRLALHVKDDPAAILRRRKD